MWIEVGDGGIALLSEVGETGAIREAALRVTWSDAARCLAGLLLHQATRWGVVRL